MEPTSSLALADVIHADFQTALSRYLQTFSTYRFCNAERMLRTIIMQNSRLIQACLPIKIGEVWIDRFCARYDWWRRLQQMSSVSQCDIDAPSAELGSSALASCDVCWWVQDQPLPLWSPASCTIACISTARQNIRARPLQFYCWPWTVEYMRPVWMISYVCLNANMQRHWLPPEVSLGHLSGCLDTYPAAINRL